MTIDADDLQESLEKAIDQHPNCGWGLPVVVCIGDPRGKPLPIVRVVGDYDEADKLVQMRIVVADDKLQESDWDAWTSREAARLEQTAAAGASVGTGAANGSNVKTDNTSKPKPDARVKVADDGDKSQDSAWQDWAEREAARFNQAAVDDAASVGAEGV
jgi:hypothetical protein